MKTLLVTDANIWIDLAAGGLLEVVFRLPYEFAMADVTFDELQSVDPNALSARGLGTLTLDDNGVAEVFRLGPRYHGLKVQDIFALVLCRHGGHWLLTGDKRLRKAADSEGVEVHGILWLLDRLIERQLLSPRQAAAALQAMIAAGARLPESAVRHRLGQWRSRGP